MKLDSSSIQASPSAAQLAWFKNAYGVTLPSDYLEFLQANNGAVCAGGCLIDVDGCERLVERFLPLLDDPNRDKIFGQYDIAVVLTQIGDRLFESEDEVVPRIIPVALMFGGDFIVFDFRSSESPTVALCDHERSEYLMPHLSPVALTFSDFLGLLR